MKKAMYTLLAGSALALSIFSGGAHAQGSVPVSAAEGGRLWFVELSGPPTADGGNLTSVRNEKAAFRRTAAAAGINYVERRSFDVLFNGFSVEQARGSTQDRALTASKPCIRFEDCGTHTEQVGRSARPCCRHHDDGREDGAGHAGADRCRGAGRHHRLGHRLSPPVAGRGVSGRAAGWAFGAGKLVGYVFHEHRRIANPNPVPDSIPDDCNGHGRHVSGIVGASGGTTGVAPGVHYVAYRVFGCKGTTTPR